MFMSLPDFGNIQNSKVELQENIQLFNKVGKLRQNVTFEVGKKIDEKNMNACEIKFGAHRGRRPAEPRQSAV